MAEMIYERIWSKCNVNCRESPVTNLNKQLYLEHENLNNDLGYKSDVIKEKLDYIFKMWEQTDFSMTDEIYDDKFSFFLARRLKPLFTHENDQKFRHSSRKYQIFHDNLPVVMKILSKPENQSLKKFLFGASSMNFTFSPEWREAKQEFMMNWGLQIQRTEKNTNAEFEYFLTTAETCFMYTLGLDDGRTPLRDHYRL